MIRFTAFVGDIFVRLAVLAFILACGPSAGAQELPQGRVGIAHQHPGDREIEKDESVVFVERFDAGSIDEVVERWESAQGASIMTLSSDSPVGSSDPRSLLITHTGGIGNGAHLYRRLMPGYEKLHYRFYVKFARDCAPIHHFFHVGGYNPATAWPQGGAGSRPNGEKRFTTGVEPFGKNWRWDFYSYWMEMRGSPPRGQTWGNSFIHDSSLRVKRDQWICVELMMQLNDVGTTNGEMALWVDGRLASHLRPGYPKGKWVFDKFRPGEGGKGVRWNERKRGPEQLEFPAGGTPFEGFRWRDAERLNLNFIWLLCYITKAPNGHESKIWFDNVVVAKKYIGPIQPPAK